MLPTPHRLPSPDVRLVMQKGRRLTLPVIQLIYRASGQALSRFAFAVPARLDKRATRRNRVKRLLSEAVRLSLDKLQAGWDCIVIARRLDINTIKEAKQITEEGFRKAGLWGQTTEARN